MGMRDHDQSREHTVRSSLEPIEFMSVMDESPSTPTELFCHHFSLLFSFFLAWRVRTYGALVR